MNAQIQYIWSYDKLGTILSNSEGDKMKLLKIIDILKGTKLNFKVGPYACTYKL